MYGTVLALRAEPEKAKEVLMKEMVNSERREFIKKSGILIATASVIQPGRLLAQGTAKSSPEKGSKEQNEIEISPVEDLMREHGNSCSYPAHL